MTAHHVKKPGGHNAHANKAMVQMMAVFAEMERDAISKRTKEALAAAKARGVGWRCSVEGRHPAAELPLLSPAPRVIRWPAAAGPTASLSLGLRSPADAETRRPPEWSFRAQSRLPRRTGQPGPTAHPHLSP